MSVTSDPAYPPAVLARVLGRVDVMLHGRVVSAGGPRQRSVLALIINAHPDPISRDVLVMGVYGDDAPPSRVRVVQTYVSNLRRRLSGGIVAEHGAYRLDDEIVAVDAVRFEALVLAALAHIEVDREAARHDLADALALWRGHPYEGVEAHVRLAADATRLEELRFRALTARLGIDLASGRHREILPELCELTHRHTTREDLIALFLLALHRSGLRGRALAAYDTARTRFRDDVGAELSGWLRDLRTLIEEDDPILDQCPLPLAAATYLSGTGPKGMRLAVQG